MKNSYLANQVKTLRTEKGYSQELLAQRTNLSLRTIQRIESGQTEPHGDTLQRLAASLDVNVADFWEGKSYQTCPRISHILFLSIYRH
ncbi:helix-turn-helix transcriptional regulator [Mucilaginibacter sp. PAMB04168]|uniref:helix-turn-helix domain-containing protein n=1 Tax=Mucilaginibacter sp. PAMB04168 TaxID=3138567 RepID=UPI0031F6F0FA